MLLFVSLQFEILEIVKCYMYVAIESEFVNGLSDSQVYEYHICCDICETKSGV